MAILAHPEPAAPATTRSLTGLTDSELVAEVRRGCDRAFEQLYERYHRRIAAYIYGMVNDYGRAEDVAQDVFMSALRRMRTTDRPIAFKPWIYEIAKNACIDQFRRARRSEEVSYDADGGLAPEDHGRLVAKEPAPDAAVDQKLALDHLCGAFGGLSQTHHEILVMRELEGLSYREIGERLGMSRPSVESTLFRARRRLGEEYQELVSGERCVRVQAIIDAAGDAHPGTRDQRRLAAHLSHCQACRRHARIAGLDASLVALPRGARAKIAAVIPLPAFLRKRWLAEDVTPLASSHHVSTLAQWSAHLGGVDPAVASWAKAAAAALALAIAGVAGGAAVSDESRGAVSTAPAPLAGAERAPRAAAPSGTPARPAPGAVPATTDPGPGGAARTPGSSPASARGAGSTATGDRGSSAGSPSSGAATTPARDAAGAGVSAVGAVTGALPAQPSTPAGASAPSTDPVREAAGAVLAPVTGGGRPAAPTQEPAVPAAAQPVTAAADEAAGAAGQAGSATASQLEQAAGAAADAAAGAARDAASGVLPGG